MDSNLAYQNDFIAKRREELIDGKPSMMSPRPGWNHVAVAGNIYTIFNNYLRGKKCTPIPDGMDLYLTDKEHYMPDFMIVCAPDKMKGNGVYGTPDLVVEVLSPSTARNDKTHKKEVYARCGVQEYWLVDPVSKSIEIYRLSGSEFLLHDVYAVHEDWQLAQMSEEERSAVVTRFKCSLFDDLEIALEDIFYRTF